LWYVQIIKRLWFWFPAKPKIIDTRASSKHNVGTGHENTFTFHFTESIGKVNLAHPEMKGFAAIIIIVG
jgi:hypothetical protein